jgi:hypothetical protein
MTERLERSKQTLNGPNTCPCADVKDSLRMLEFRLTHVATMDKAENMMQNIESIFLSIHVSLSDRLGKMGLTIPCSRSSLGRNYLVSWSRRKSALGEAIHT